MSTLFPKVNCEIKFDSFSGLMHVHNRLVDPVLSIKDQWVDGETKADILYLKT